MKHVQDLNKHIIEETMRQVGHLSELYEDARPEKYKKKKYIKNKTRSFSYTFTHFIRLLTARLQGQHYVPN